jgi:predicted kinase
MTSTSNASTVVLMAGLPATGKTTLAEALAASTGGIVLNKDRVREAMFPGKWTDYTPEQDEVVMTAVYSAARYLLKHQNPSFLFLDGRTYRQKSQVDQAIALAEESGSNWRILHLVCDRDVIRKRLAGGTHIARNRDFELYSQLEQSLEPIDRPVLLVDTTQPFNRCFEACLNYLNDDKIKDGDSLAPDTLS